PPAPVRPSPKPIQPAPAPAPVAAAPAAPASAPRAAGPAIKELESFLVNFVVEQTGYPPEVVELDADLEADLGIDSIKKAQLFGELAEYFDVQPDENLTLDDFPTLRHVLSFLVGADLKKNLIPGAPDGDDEPNAVAADPSSLHSPSNGDLTSSSATNGAAVAALAVPFAPAQQFLAAFLRLSGTPYEMGFEHGRQKKVEIRRILRRYADLAGPDL